MPGNEARRQEHLAEIEAALNKDPKFLAEAYDARRFIEYLTSPPSTNHRQAVEGYIEKEVNDTAAVPEAERAWTEVLDILRIAGGIDTSQLVALRQEKPELYAEVIGRFAGSLMATRREAYIDGVVAGANQDNAS